MWKHGDLNALVVSPKTGYFVQFFNVSVETKLTFTIGFEATFSSISGYFYHRFQCTPRADDAFLSCGFHSFRMASFSVCVAMGPFCRVSTYWYSVLTSHPVIHHTKAVFIFLENPQEAASPARTMQNASRTLVKQLEDFASTEARQIVLISAKSLCVGMHWLLHMVKNKIEECFPNANTLVMCNALVRLYSETLFNFMGNPNKHNPFSEFVPEQISRLILRNVDICGGLWLGMPDRLQNADVMLAVENSDWNFQPDQNMEKQLFGNLEERCDPVLAKERCELAYALGCLERGETREMMDLLQRYVW